MLQPTKRRMRIEMRALMLTRFAACVEKTRHGGRMSYAAARSRDQCVTVLVLQMCARTSAIRLSVYG